VTNLPDLTWTEVDRASRRALVVPLGSLEQHGPHLPLDTDTRIALAVAVATATATGREGVMAAPPIALGASGEHASFPGTLSIGTEALARLLVELGRDSARDWDAMLLVNAHSGNRDAISSALARLHGEGRRCDVFHVGARSGDAHAGRSETSLMLHIDPRAVRQEHAVAGETRPLDELMDRLRREGVRSVSPNGVLGDPRQATAEEGRRLLAELVQRCTAALGALLDRVPTHA
jgi:mycofactocin system creatininase family protein